MDLKELEGGADPRIHWYYQSKQIPLVRYARALLEQFPERWDVVDVGAGSGFFAERLAEVFPDRFGQIRLVDTGYPAIRTTMRGRTRLIHQPHLPEQIDHSLVLLMDVIEHVADDIGLLTDLRQRSRGRNHFFLTVPAFAGLWSYHDEVLGHHRRYTRAGLIQTLRRAGFAVERCYYLYGGIFPLVWAYRKCRRAPAARSDMGPVTPWINQVLLAYHRLEMRASRGNRWCGLTCAAEGTFSEGSPHNG